MAGAALIRRSSLRGLICQFVLIPCEDALAPATPHSDLGDVLSAHVRHQNVDVVILVRVRVNPSDGDPFFF